MRSLSIIAVLASGLLASAPAVAQVTSPGPVYYNSAPGTGAPPPMVYDPGGPVYYNQSGAVPPGAPRARVSPNPPYIPAPQGGMVSANPPHYNAPQYNAPRYNGQQRNGGRWGGMVNGRWWGGVQAPGGWGGYHRPSRGWTLPSYWMTSNFGIPDYYSFGLRAPGQGYFWVRYYDDAVLVDRGGRVWDSVGGIAWADAEAYAGDGYASAESQAYASTDGGYRQPIEPVDPNQYYGYPGGYAPSAAGGPPTVQYRQGCANTCPGGGTYYSNGGGYYYAAPGMTTTTIVIQPATTVTTTTIEEQVIEERAVTTYVSRPRRVYHKPRPRPRQCSCACGCR